MSISIGDRQASAGSTAVPPLVLAQFTEKPMESGWSVPRRPYWDLENFRQANKDKLAEIFRQANLTPDQRELYTRVAAISTMEKGELAGQARALLQLMVTAGTAGRTKDLEGITRAALQFQDGYFAPQPQRPAQL